MQINNLNNNISYNIDKTGNKQGYIEESKWNKNIESMKSVDKVNNKKEYNEEEIIKAIEDANEEFVVYDRRFEFSIHEKTKQITIKIFDTVTDEIIREVPPEKILDTIAGIWEVAGILVDEKI